MNGSAAFPDKLPPLLFAGFGGHALELVDALKTAGKLPSSLACYVLPETWDSWANTSFVPVCHKDALLFWRQQGAMACLATGNPMLRQRLYHELIELDFRFVSVVHPKAQVSDDALLEDGLNIMAFALVTGAAHLEKGVLVNAAATVHHGTRIGAFSEIGPGARVLGEVKIGERCFIGAQATLLPGVCLGNDVVVGAGAVVTRNVAHGQRIKGIPAK